MSNVIDLGHGHTVRFFGFHPDRELNPHLDGIPDEERCGAIIDHPHAQTGEACTGAITFDTYAMRKTEPDRALWSVASFDPLTVEPSVLCTCGDHGFIRGGKWIPA